MAAQSDSDYGKEIPLDVPDALNQLNQAEGAATPAPTPSPTPAPKTSSASGDQGYSASAAVVPGTPTPAQPSPLGQAIVGNSINPSTKLRTWGSRKSPLPTKPLQQPRVLGPHKRGYYISKFDQAESAIAISESGSRSAHFHSPPFASQ